MKKKVFVLVLVLVGLAFPVSNLIVKPDNSGQLAELGAEATAVAATLQGLAAAASRGSLREMGVRAFVFARNAGSAIVFFVVAMILFGYDMLWRFLFKEVLGILS